jgi:S-adenosyl methyltransferase
VTRGTTPPFGIDTTVPTTARMYDWWLGGHDNFAADRAAALAVSEAAPEAPLLARENHEFLRRAVRFLAAEAGITQFLDIGTGLPTQGNVHQIAQQVNPDARVVYVDNDHCKPGCAHAYSLVQGPDTNGSHYGARCRVAARLRGLTSPAGPS